MESESYIFTYLYEIFQSPGWSIPVMSFIDSKCLDSENFTVENSQDLHKSYQSLIKSMLTNLAASLQVPSSFLISSIRSAMEEPFYYYSFEKLRASYDLRIFVEILNARNKEITNEALEELNKEENESSGLSKAQIQEREKRELELAISNSIKTRKSEENITKAMEKKELEDIITALEISTQEILDHEQSELNSLQRMKSELLAKLQSEENEKIFAMSEQEKLQHESKKQELQEFKEKFNESQKNNKKFQRQGKNLQKGIERMKDEIRWLEEECQNLEKALKLEEGRMQALKPKTDSTELSEEPQGVVLNKVQVKKVADFSIQELIKGSEMLEESPKSPSKEKNPLQDEINAKKARYLKMKEMIQARKAAVDSGESELKQGLIEKKPMPALLPISNPADLLAKQNFLKDIN